jgi:hypothetical protein
VLNLNLDLPRISTGPFNFGAVEDRQADTRLGWDAWLRKYLPSYVGFEFAGRHRELWEWVEAIRPGIRPRPFTAFWPRGGGKSSTAELSVVRVGFRRARRYGWYISGTQDKADKHVETIASILESPQLAKCDPRLASRKVGKYGHSKGWRRSRVWTASNLTVDALGLDVGSRGAKVEDARPDFMVIDDVDDKHDSADTIRKKIETLTTSVLPAGSADCAVLFVQNIIHPGSIAARLAGATPFETGQEFLIERIISGPFPAVAGLTYEHRFDPEIERPRYYITGGEATWEGQSLAICQRQINDWGLTAFLQEAQHEVELSGGIWDHIEFRHIPWDEVPWGEIVRVVVWVDPAVTSTDQSDSMGLQADALAEDGTIFRLYSWEAVTSPEDALRRAIRKGIELGAQHVGVETDQGGDTWESVYARACAQIRAEGGLAEGKQFPPFTQAKAGSGVGSKLERNQQMLADYERGRVVHVTGTHETLERSLRRFPLKPLDLADAAFWGWHDLRGDTWWIL